MRKKIIIIMLLVFSYASLRFGYRFLGKGHNYNYSIESSNHLFTINEKFVNKGNNSNYYFKILVGDNTFSLRTFYNFKNSSKIIKNVYYYNDDEYSCILPVFKYDLILSDIICKKNNGIFYYYHDLKGIDSGLDAFALLLNNSNYKADNWIDEAIYSKYDSINVYNDNVFLTDYMIITDYKGLYFVNSNLKKDFHIQLFNNDVYKEKIEYLYNNYYIVADYNQKFRFHQFNVIDVKNGNKSIISSEEEISYNSYIQGAVDDKIYIFDCDSKKQYSVDINNKSVSRVGGESNGILIYQDGEWNRMNATAVGNKKIVFNKDNKSNGLDFNNFDMIKLDILEQYGYYYYYYYQYIDGKYLIYRSNVEDDNLIYLFTTSNLEKMFFNKDAVYFVEGSYIKRYSDFYGIRNIVKYDELSFNGNINFYVYVDG